MKILKIILYAMVGLMAVVLVAALFVREQYRISREITIKQPKQVVFDYVRLLKNQDNFSVWAKIDPNMKKAWFGTDGKVGFISAWDSQVKEAGKGEQEITNILEGERIDYELRFFKPRKSKDHAFISFKAVGDQNTLVKWGFEGRIDYPMNLAFLFMDIDDMLGKDLNQGLANLKGILEK